MAGAANAGQNQRGNHAPVVPEAELSGTASDCLVDLLILLVQGRLELELLHLRRIAAQWEVVL